MVVAMIAIRVVQVAFDEIINVIAVRVVKMPVIQIVGVAVVLHRQVAAVVTVGVRMRWMDFMFSLHNIPAAFFEAFFRPGVLALPLPGKRTFSGGERPFGAQTYIDQVALREMAQPETVIIYTSMHWPWQPVPSPHGGRNDCRPGGAGGL